MDRGCGCPLDCRPHRSARRKGGGMIRPTKNPLIPNSLAADGNQGAESKALGPCGAQDNPQAAFARILALTAVHGARCPLDRYALVTARPARGVVDELRRANVGTPVTHAPLDNRPLLGNNTE